MENHEINSWVNDIRASNGNSDRQSGDERVHNSTEIFLSQKLGSLAHESRYEKASPKKLVEYGEKIAAAYFTQLAHLADLETERTAHKDILFDIKRARERGSKKLGVEMAWNNDAITIQDDMKQEKGFSAVQTTGLFGTMLERCMAVGKEQFGGLSLRTYGGPKWAKISEHTPTSTSR